MIGTVNKLIQTATPPPAAKITGNGHMKSHGDTKKTLADRQRVIQRNNSRTKDW